MGKRGRERRSQGLNPLEFSAGANYIERVSYTLGILCHGWHEAAAVVVNGGEVVAAAEEERFTRRKLDPGFPRQAIGYCLRQAGVQARNSRRSAMGLTLGGCSCRKAAHLARYFPRSLNLLATRTERLQRMNAINADLRESLGFRASVYRLNHHLCHAASSFLGSPFEEAAILSLDGIGDWEACWWGRGRGCQIEELGTINWPRSLGHVYAAFTEYLGFQSFADEYRVMGLAAYGEPGVCEENGQEVFWPTEAGYAVNPDYFVFQTGHVPRYSAKLVREFGPPLPANSGDIPEHYRNIAASLQAQLEKVIAHLAALVTRQAGSKKLCLAGGVALNCAANARLLAQGIVEDLYVPPCPSDAGVALGAAWLAALRGGAAFERRVLRSALLGPEYTDGEIEAAMRASDLTPEGVADPAARAAELLSEGKVVGWFQGRLEFGHRALGARSILADPRRAEMKNIINAKVKFREPFRPFAPSVLEERANEFFHCARSAPFMTELFAVRQEKRPLIPAVTHVDGTARIQTVSRSLQPLYWNLIRRFGELTGIPVVLNTSFNVKGEPIVNTPADAVDTFLKTDLDGMIAGKWLVLKQRS